MDRNYSHHRRALRWTQTVAALLLLTLAGLTSACRHTLNSTAIPIPPGWNDNGGGPGPGPGPNGTPVQIVGVSATKAGGGLIHAGDKVVITVTFTGDIDPFILGYIIDTDCIDASTIPSMPRTVTTSPDSFTVTTLASAAGRDCTVDVGIADADNNVDAVSQSFHIEDDVIVPPNNDPTISATTNDAECTVTVTVDDADGDDVAVSQTVPGSLTGLDTGHTFVGGSGAFTFSYVPNDILVGGSGTISFTADDGNGGSASIGANLVCAGVTLTVDTLYAIPTRSTVAVGAPLTILVGTGVPANPFEYMNGVRVVVEQASGFDYVSNSFNVGAVGGAADDTDGYWTAMDPSGGFLLAPDSFYQRTDDGSGNWALDFNLTPLGGSNQHTAKGALFNFQATFETAGTYTLGFQEANVVDRTFYNDDSQATNYHWADVTNNHPGVDNSIVVTP